MKKSTLIDLLSKLSQKEVKEFGEYIGSPFFNKNQSIIRLYDYLRTQYPLFEKEKVAKKFVYSKLFPKIKYNDGFMRTLIFSLCTLAEDYLSYIRFKNTYYKEKLFLLFELNDRHIDRLFERNVHAISKKLDEEVVRDIDYYEDKYNLENEKYTYYFRKKPDAYEKTFKEVSMSAMMNYLTVSYLTSAINDYNRLLNFKNMYNVDFDLGQIEKLFEAIDPKHFRDIPCVIISYYGMMLFLKENDISNFYTIKELLGKYESSLDRNHVYNISQNLINYCNRNMNKGHPELLRERFEIYKMGIEKKIFPIQGKTNFRFFTNVTETAVKLKEFEWAQHFIKKFKNQLPEDIRENTCNYSLSLYEFASGNFEKSLEFLSRVRYNDVYHKLKCKSLIAMLYYELDYNEQLLSHIDAFNHFIINDQLVNNERKRIYSGFIRYVKKIERIRQKNLAGEAEKMLKKITDDQRVFYKDWLIEKLDECIK
jgi:hypothetical protein